MLTTGSGVFWESAANASRPASILVSRTSQWHQLSRSVTTNLQQQSVPVELLHKLGTFQVLAKSVVSRIVMSWFIHIFILRFVLSMHFL